VPVRDLAEVTGRHLGLPVTSIPMAEAGEHFGRLDPFVSRDQGPPVTNATVMICP
jgi:hypothetical protein